MKEKIINEKEYHQITNWRKYFIIKKLKKVNLEIVNEIDKKIKEKTVTTILKNIIKSNEKYLKNETK